MPLFRSQGGGRLTLAIIIALFTLASYYMSSEVNPITGEKQHISISADQEIALGLQAAPQMADAHGGLSPNREHQQLIDAIGERLITQSVARETDWRFDFHVLADAETVNAFALPGGQVFITEGLLKRLESEDQIAGVLAHEIGHVIARHGAQRLAKQQLTQGLTSAAVLASGDYSTGQMAQMIGQVVNMRYGREDELESDTLGVRLMHEAGFQPEALIRVMEILAEASGGGRQPEFFSTHPNSENRIQKIKEAIAKL